MLSEKSPRSLGEECLDSFLAAVPEGRITHVVGQTGRRYNLPDLAEERIGQLRTLLHDGMRHVVAQRHAHAGHFERMGQPVVYEDAARQGKHLCLVLQSAERCREDQPVVVAFELRPVVVPLRMALLLTEPAVGNQFYPVHNHCKSNAFLAKILQFRAKSVDIWI